jgi:transposase
MRHVRSDEVAMSADPVLAPCMIEIDVVGGHRMRISGSYDPEALARLIRGLTV